MTKLVYLVGKTGAGKSTTAQKLQTALAARNVPTFILRFAYPLHNLAVKVFGHNDTSLKNLPVAQTTESTNQLILALEEFIEDMGKPADALYWEDLLPLLNQRVLSPRMLMNAAGHAARQLDNAIFARAAERTAVGLAEKYKDAVIIFEDARFHEEVSPMGDIVLLESGERGVVQSIDELYHDYVTEQLKQKYTVLDVRTPEATDKSIQEYVEKLLSK
jgi:hypothetical protein